MAVTGTNNQIDTVNGTALQLTDMNVSSVDFEYQRHGAAAAQ